MSQGRCKVTEVPSICYLFPYFTLSFCKYEIELNVRGMIMKKKKMCTDNNNNNNHWISVRHSIPNSNGPCQSEFVWNRINTFLNVLGDNT